MRIVTESVTANGLMSALGQKQTWRAEIPMSALPPKADIGGRELDVRFVPEPEVPGLSELNDRNPAAARIAARTLARKKRASRMRGCLRSV
jgi:hypothetical protein